MLDGGGHIRNAFNNVSDDLYTKHHNNIWYGGVLSEELIRCVKLPKRVVKYCP